MLHSQIVGTGNNGQQLGHCNWEYFGTEEYWTRHWPESMATGIGIGLKSNKEWTRMQPWV